MRALCLTLSALLIALTGAAPLQRRILPQDVASRYGSRCLDGSAAGYYIRTFAPDPRKWVIFLQGGSACESETECRSRARTDLGSSSRWPPTWDDVTGILSANATLNPFAGFNHVWLRYCSADTHTGRQFTVNSFGVRFAGHLNIVASLDYLLNTTTLRNATDVVLAGGSAGGIGVITHADYVAERLAPARVVAVPQAGFYFPANITTYPAWQSNNFTSINAVISAQAVDLWDSFVDVSCELDVGEAQRHRCWDASFVYPYITTPLFVAQNLFDKQQLYAVLLCQQGAPGESGFQKFFGAAMMHSLQPKDGDGLFAPACVLQVENLCMASPTTIAGVTYRAALYDWFTGAGTVAHRLIDDCTDPISPCNQNCPSVCGVQ